MTILRETVSGATLESKKEKTEKTRKPIYQENIFINIALKPHLSSIIAFKNRVVHK